MNRKNRVLIDIQDDISSPAWMENVEPFIFKVMEKLKIRGEEVSILFCSDSYIKELNKTYRNIDEPTDVLSFENSQVYKDEEGKWKCAGDVIISLDTLPVNASYFETEENTELKRLLIHGLMHINGYDHGEEHIQKGIKPESKMLKIQEKILEQLKDEKIIK